MANGAEPRKGEVLNWEIFKGKWFTAQVEDAIKDKGGKRRSIRRGRAEKGGGATLAFPFSGYSTT
jgi:hypothetical protein